MSREEVLRLAGLEAALSDALWTARDNRDRFKPGTPEWELRDRVLRSIHSAAEAYMDSKWPAKSKTDEP